MMAQKLMSENKDNPFNSRFFQPSDAMPPTGQDRRSIAGLGYFLPVDVPKYSREDGKADLSDARLGTPQVFKDIYSGMMKFDKIRKGEATLDEIKQFGFDTSLNVTGGSLVGSKLLKNAVPKNALSMGLYSDTSNRFLHGTLTDNISDIKKSGLIPGVGKNTKEAYGEYSDLLEDALYVSRPEDAERALSAIRNQVGIKLKKQASEVTDEDIVNNGALVVTRSKKDTAIYEAGEGGETFSISGEKSYFDTNVSDEAGDIVSKDILPATGILKGNALKKFFEKQGLLSSGSKET